jgi:protein involved in temperature-dependent protein secretion
VTPSEALAHGKLRAAIEEQTRIVSEDPSDAQRLYLFELLAVGGQRAEAAKQLLAIKNDSPEWAASLLDFRDLLHADQFRSRRAPMPFPDVPVSEYQYARLRVFQSLLRSQTDRASKAASQAEKLAFTMSGHINGQEFVDGLRDFDDRYGATLEVVLGRRAYSLCWSHVKTVRFLKREWLWNIVYLPAEVVLQNGIEFDCHIPMTYPCQRRTSGWLRLALDVEFDDAEGVMVGQGARTYIIDGEEMMLSECRQIDIRSVG